MKAIIHLWAGDGEAQLSLIGLTPGKDIEPDQLLTTVGLIFDIGLNVMLYHGTEKIIIWVDTKRFQQR